MPSSFVRYSDAVEVVPPDESETIDKILQSQHRLSSRTQQKYGHAVRVSHAKSHGVAVGELVVPDDLPEPLRQGLFAKPGRYPVIVRLSNVPGEIMSDAVATQRGLSIKVLGVEGEMLPTHAGEVTQDFVLDTGNRFAAANAKAFLMTHLGLEHGPQMPEAVKATVSKASRFANKALQALGGDSANLDFFGHPRIHPLAEAYYTQAPIRYGDYIAKLAVVPLAPAQTALRDAVLDTARDRDAMRTATVSYLRDQDAAFDVRVQLCTDLQKMPVENANKEWSEEESPYQTVARLTLPRQDAYTDARRAYVDDGLSFCVSHSLAAHRPLGSIMRARLRAYPQMSQLRRKANGRPLTEPRSIEEVPA
ncbi:MAG: catalase family protein [Pseudomonadota bacterium]|nr:catalase family protein [Pseudomonadota bacterium]